MRLTKISRLVGISSLVSLYALVSAFAFFLAYWIRFDCQLTGQFNEFVPQMVRVGPWVIFIQVFSLILIGQATVLPTYFSVIDLKRQLIAITPSTFGLLFGMQAAGDHIPYGVRILDFGLFALFLTGARLLLRYFGESQRRAKDFPGGDLSCVAKATVIVGAGSTGSSLVRELLSKPGLHLRPVAFFDDDEAKWGQNLHGVKIVGCPELLRKAPWKDSVRKVIIAMPTARVSRVGEVARIAAQIGIACETVPALHQLLSGSVRIPQLRSIQIQDLLQRTPIELDQAGILGVLKDQVVIVTGGGGSIGSELCRQILVQLPRLLVLIERSEVQIFQIEQDLIKTGAGSVLVPVVADINDVDRIRSVFEKYRPSVLFHAAAHKHVPMMEIQPGEAIFNNAFGTVNLARVALEFGLERFVFISTDKAINPTNVMGASKRMAEIFLQAFHAANPGSTRFMSVRFGNVLGSSGSVVPIFQKQIAEGGPITVTHPEVTRYFMTIPEAVGLVLQAAALGVGGEIFVLDMGVPVKIVDLARQLIVLSGYQADVDIEIKFTGLRPGEKLFEELSHQNENLVATGHSKIFRFVCEPSDLGEVESSFRRIELMLNTSDTSKLKLMMQQVVPDYNPYLN